MTGKNLSIASFVCGILSLLCIFFGKGAWIGLALGIVAIVLAVNAKKKNYDDGFRKTGFVLGIIGTSLCSLTFISCVICAGIVGAAVSSLANM